MSEGTPDNSGDAMLARLERLERSNRVMKLIALGAVIGCIALNAVPALSAFPHGPRATDAQSFNLVSSKGVLVATLAQGPNGGYLAFFDSKGKAEMLVGTSSSAGDKTIGVATFDGNALLPGNGKARQVWAMAPNSIGNSIFDGAGNVRLSNVTDGDGSNAGSFFYDATPQLRAGVGVGDNGPGAFFNDSTGTARLLEGVLADDSGASLSMTNSGATHHLATLSALGDGSATTLQIEDNSGVARAIAGVGSQSGEIIQLNNAGGTETFRAPCSGPACP
jgi:hypothetical protein